MADGRWQMAGGRGRPGDKRDVGRQRETKADKGGGRRLRETRETEGDRGRQACQVAGGSCRWQVAGGRWQVAAAGGKWQVAGGRRQWQAADAMWQAAGGRSSCA